VSWTPLTHTLKQASGWWLTNSYLKPFRDLLGRVKGEGMYIGEIMFYSQIRQDEAANYIINEDAGYFLDIGAGTNFETSWRPLGYHSNTLFLEQSRGWNGICIDLEEEWVESSSKFRSCNLLRADLLEENINDILKRFNCPDVIDYISFDVDAAQHKVFNDFNFDKYKFRFMTIEHNLYLSRDSKSNFEVECRIWRQVLADLGYRLLIENVIFDGHGPVEDWWVDGELFDKHKYIAGKNVNAKQINLEIR